MKIQIGNKISILPQRWEDLNRKALRYIYLNTSSNLYKSRLEIFKIISNCSSKLLKQWESEAGEDFEIELEDVIRQSTDFLFQRLEDGNYKLSSNIYPPVPCRFGEGFKNASFNEFAMIDKLLKSSDTNALIKYFFPDLKYWQWFEKWERIAIVHYITSCYHLVIDNLPASMRTDNNSETNNFGMAMVMMSMAGDKLGTIKETKQTNIWDIVVEFNRIDEENKRLKSKSKNM